jgi:hypothetical protein
MLTPAKNDPNTNNFDRNKNDNTKYKPEAKPIGSQSRGTPPRRA